MDEAKDLNKNTTFSFQKPLVISLLLALLALAVFWPVTRSEFLNYRDPDYLTKNSHVQSGLTSENVTWAFQNNDAGHWQPLTWLSHLLDVQLYGLDPASHHFTTLLIHIANTILLFLLLRGLTGALWQSALAAALFAVHPLHVEPVAWISERKETVSTFFGLLALGAYARYVRNLMAQAPKIKIQGCYAMALLFFGLASLSSPMMSLPLLLAMQVALDFWPLNRLANCFRDSKTSLPSFGFWIKWIKFSADKIPFLVLGVVCLVSGSSIPANPSSEFTHALVLAFRYLEKAVWPSSLATPYPLLTGVPGWEILGAGLVLCGISFGVFAMARSHPPVAAGWIWFLFTLSPTLFLTDSTTSLFSDSHAYFPVIGIFIMVVWGLGEFFRLVEARRILLGTIGSILLVTTIVTTSLQLRHWQNSETLFRHTVRVTKNNYLAHHHLALALASQGQNEEAATQFSRALEINPAHDPSRQQLAAIPRKTIPLASRVKTSQETSFAEAYVLGTLGYNLSQLGAFAEAEEQLAKTVHARPDDSEAHSKLAEVLYTLGKFDEAVLHFAEAVRLNPRDLGSRKSWGLCLGLLGKPKEASQQFRELTHLKPQDPEVFYYLGLALVMQNKGAEAIEAYGQAVRLDPDSTTALNDLAWILATHPDPKLRDGREAVLLAERACKLSQGRAARFLGTLDAAYAEAGRFADAIATAQKTYELAKATHQMDVAEAAQERLKLYRAKKPYRQP